MRYTVNVSNPHSWRTHARLFCNTSSLFLHAYGTWYLQVYTYDYGILQYTVRYTDLPGGHVFKLAKRIPRAMRIIPPPRCSLVHFAL